MDRILLILLSVLLLACKTAPSEHISSVDMQTPALDLQSALATTDETGRIGNLIMFLRPQLGVESLPELLSASERAKDITPQLLTAIPGYYFGHPWLTSGIVTPGIRHSVSPTDGSPITGFGIEVDGMVVGVVTYKDLDISPGMAVELVGFLAGTSSLPRFVVAHTVEKRGTFREMLRQVIANQRKNPR